MVDAFNEYYLRGKILYLEGKYTDCINPYEQALRIASSNPVLGDKLPDKYSLVTSFLSQPLLINVIFDVYISTNFELKNLLYEVEK